MDQLIAQIGERLRNAKSKAEYNAILRELQKHTGVVDAIKKTLLRKKAQAGVTVEAFSAFYELLYGFPIPKHMDISKSWQAHEEGVPLVLMGARGFWKTVTYVTFDAFLIGHNPGMTGLITGANDNNCAIIAKQLASIIEFHPEWKEVFPNIVPDQKGWGVQGYWVRDSSVSQEEWEAKRAGIIDPTFIGGGYASSSINGKHPSLFLHADDLHDIDSWSSETERTRIKNVFLSQIIKTVIKKENKITTWVHLLGVPFAKDDTLNTVKDTGNCVFVNIPCMTRAAEGTEGAVYIDGRNKKTGAVYEDIAGWWKLTNPEIMGVDSVLTERSYGKFSFWQMYMMDIETARASGLRYYLYDNTKIDRAWPVVGGADPTTFEDIGVAPQHSHFALAYLAKTPNQTAVVVDGFLKQCSLTEAKDAILQAQSMFPQWRITGVENVGVGKVFFQYLLTDPRVRAVDSSLTNLSGKGIRSKPERQKHEVSPWLESATLLISDANTPFLIALRKLYDNFYDLSPHDEAWDAGDALYHAMKLLPELWRTPMLETLAPVNSRDAYRLQSAWSSI